MKGHIQKEEQNGALLSISGQIRRQVKEDRNDFRDIKRKKKLKQMLRKKLLNRMRGLSFNHLKLQ